jgi:hypothetical protein
MSVRCWSLFAVSIFACAAGADIASFTVAEVKPHFGCKSADGQNRVRSYVSDLVSVKTGIIALLEMEFGLAQPAGYTAFGASCGAHRDPAVALVNEAQFSVVSTIGATIAGNYSAMPYIGGGYLSDSNLNEMCASDPSGKIGPGGVVKVGGRPYSGAVLSHKATGKEICVIIGTFAHCMYPWSDQFMSDIEKGCGNRQLLFIVDTNAGCEIPTVRRESHLHMDEIIAFHHKQDWGPCHDPGYLAEPTCCNDFPEFPYPRFQYDRTSVCRGGRVEEFKVEQTFVCADSRAEHLFTTATIHLAQTEEESENCLDKPACAMLGSVFDPKQSQTTALPLDGRCCPTSTATANLPCCQSHPEPLLL